MDILLVDDDETLRMSLRMLLESEGYQVVAAGSGEEAIESAKLRYFDLILCDVRMPGIDGLETIAELKESVSDAHFIIMTGYASEEAPIKALRLGVDDYINKPFDIPLFLEKVRGVARRRRQAARSVGTSLWDLVASIRDEYPALAARCEEVERRCLAWGRSLELSVDDLELLKLGSWFFPLSLVVSQEDEQFEGSTVDGTRPTDSLVALLRTVSFPSGGNRMHDLFRSAISAATGQELPKSLDPEVERTLADCQDFSQISAADDNDFESPFEIKTFGRFEVKIEGRLVERKAWQSANAKWLFVYLLSRGGQSVPEDRLASVFWPGSPSKKAHRALLSSIHRARKALQNSEILVRYDKSYGISRDCDYWLDSERFLEFYKRGNQDFYRSNSEAARESFEAALELYQGSYLPDCQEDWSRKLRSEFILKAVDAAEKIAKLHLGSNPALSEQWSRKAILMEPSSEPAWATLFQALAAQGRRGEVESAYQDCVAALQEAVQLKPGASLREAYEDSLA